MSTSAYDPPRRMRLRLKPVDATLGSVDGAWWPRTRDLAVELPEVIQTIGIRIPGLERIGYHVSDWDLPPTTKIILDGKFIRLESFNTWTRGMLRFVGAGGSLTVAVLSPDADPQIAHEAMMRAAGRTNSQSVNELTAVASAGSAERHRRAELDWDYEGGHQGAGLAGGDTGADHTPPAWAVDDDPARGQ